MCCVAGERPQKRAARETKEKKNGHEAKRLRQLQFVAVNLLIVRLFRQIKMRKNSLKLVHSLWVMLYLVIWRLARYYWYFLAWKKKILILTLPNICGGGKNLINFTLETPLTPRNVRTVTNKSSHETSSFFVLCEGSYVIWS